jgi:iron complex transport system ATP-binding protein
MILDVRGLTGGYPRRDVIREVTFSLRAGQWVSVVGPNGAGKTTLLRLILGFLEPRAGDVRVGDHRVKGMDRAEIAKRISLVPQHHEASLPYTVPEVVMMGRTPWLGRFMPPGPEDRKAVRRAMAEARVEHLADRTWSELSGGERQRVMLARAFAQDTPLLLLDEPAGSLDLHHERLLFERVRRRQSQGTAVLAVLHDLAAAAEFSDRILVMDEGRAVAFGPPREVLGGELLERVFRVKAKLDWPRDLARPSLHVQGLAGDWMRN